MREQEEAVESRRCCHHHAASLASPIRPKKPMATPMQATACQGALPCWCRAFPCSLPNTPNPVPLHAQHACYICMPTARYCDLYLLTCTPGLCTACWTSVPPFQSRITTPHAVAMHLIAPPDATSCTRANANQYDCMPCAKMLASSGLHASSSVHACDNRRNQAPIAMHSPDAGILVPPKQS
jgi:hypothetical protein